jgi:hypothetical protein
MAGLNIPSTWDAKWRPLYEHAKALEHGASLTYAEMSAITGLDVAGADRWVIYAADRELQIHDHRALKNIRGVGYRIAEPEEHHGIVRERLRRSKRQVRKGILVGTSTDLARIKDPAAQRAVVQLTDHLREVDSRMRYTERRLARVEASIDQVREEAAGAAGAMEERVRRLEELLTREKSDS